MSNIVIKVHKVYKVLSVKLLMFFKTIPCHCEAQRAEAISLYHTKPCHCEERSDEATP